MGRGKRTSGARKERRVQAKQRLKESKTMSESRYITIQEDVNVEAEKIAIRGESATKLGHATFYELFLSKLIPTNNLDNYAKWERITEAFAESEGKREIVVQTDDVAMLVGAFELFKQNHSQSLAWKCRKFHRAHLDARTKPLPKEATPEDEVTDAKAELAVAEAKRAALESKTDANQPAEDAA